MKPRKGIVLAGGNGTRLHPATLAGSKQLLPVYDRPMIYYPISTLMLAGIREILVITTEPELPRFKSLLGDGKQWGVNFSYCTQAKPEGIAQALILGEDFLDNGPSVLVLGDNIFYGRHLSQRLAAANARTEGATVFTYPVSNPEQYGVISYDGNKPVAIDEKPKKATSPNAVTGLYFYDETAVDIAKSLKPSARGELEITDVNRVYLERGQLAVQKLVVEDDKWFDSGTLDSLLDTSKFVELFEELNGFKICCPEEIAWRNGWIDTDALSRLAHPLKNTRYGEYLERLSRE
jgi:glucose-1-phosphate thymidylyltransferase